MTTDASSHGNQNQPSLPNQPFFSWLRTHTTLFIGQTIGLLSVVTVPIALYYYYSHALPAYMKWEVAGDFVVYAHLLFLVLFIAFLIRGLDKNDTGSYRARLVHKKLGGALEDRDDLEVFSIRQVGRFKRHFLRFWCAMLCLYLVFAIQPLFSVAPDDSLQALSLKEMFRTELFPLLSFILNNISLIFIFCCFSVLHIPKDPTDNSSPPVSTVAEGDAKPQPAVRLPTRKWLRFSGLTRRIVQRFSDPKLDELKLRQRTLAWSFTLGIAALSFTFPLIMLTKIDVDTNWSEYPAIFDALSGTINAIALALLVARLDSKLIGLPSWLICILYFYAGVQPMFVVFELHPQVYASIKTAVLLVVFIFKIYFFLIIFYSLQTGRMFNYFFCSGILNEHVKKLKQTASLKNEPKTQPATTVEEKSAEPAIDVSPQPSAKASGQVRTVSPVKKDWRAVWFRRLGVTAIVLFTSSLLTYVLLSGAHRFWLDSSDLSTLVIFLHVILLLVICFWVLFARYRETKRGSRPREKARSRVRAELRFKLADPGSPQARKRKFKELSKRTKRQFKAFTLYFRLFWLSLLLLYLAMGLSVTFVDDIPPLPVPLVVAPTIERKADFSDRSAAGANADFSSSALPEAKHPISEQTHTEPKGDPTSETTRRPNSAPLSSSQVVEHRRSIDQLPGYVTFSFIFFVINNFTVLVLFWCFAVLYIPADDVKFEAKRRLLRNYSLLLFMLLTVLIPLLAIIVKSHGFTESEADKIPTILGAVGGTLNAVAFALLIARLDSRIIGLPLLLVTVLYAYASLQPLFVTFNQPSNLLQFIATSAMIAAFIFKICLVLMVGHVRRSGGLIDYLWFFPVLSNSVNSIFANQFEVKAYSPRPGLFTFSIFNKNVEMYRAAEWCPTRAQCDGTIKTLVEAMKKRENYSKLPKKLQGTYWVEVKSAGKVICESTGLRSPKEVDELIDESIEKVPYCKYDRG